MPDPIQKLHALVVISDMVFESRIRSTAQAVGAEVLLVKPNAEISEYLDKHRPALVIIDLSSTGEVGLGAVDAARTHETTPRVLAYLPHVDTELAKRAVERGAYEVMPRSLFNKDLPRILAACAES